MEIIGIDPLFLVINKPSALLSVPGRGSAMQDCVVNRIKELFPDCLGLGIPIVGDRLYGTGKQPGGLLLHAAYLAFQHPASSQRMSYHLPPAF